jgi:hypothetical protein
MPSITEKKRKKKNMETNKNCEGSRLCWRWAYSNYFQKLGYSVPPTREVLFFSGYAAPEMMPKAGIFAESIPLNGNTAGLCPAIKFPEGKKGCKEYKKYQRLYERKREAKEISEPRKNISPDVRRSVAASCRYTCVYCGRNINTIHQGKKIGGVIDHFIPLKLGGTDSIENLKLACRECNSSKAFSIWQLGCRVGFYERCSI